MNGRQAKIGNLVDAPARSRRGFVTAQLLPADEYDSIAAAAAAIDRRELIILPTDTVYGIGAGAFDESAIQHLFVAKRRSQQKGIPILIAGVNDLDRIVSKVPPLVEDLIARFWPGPLTLVLAKRKELPTSVSQTNAVAVRLPDHDICREIIRMAGGALAATSANLSGHPPALDARMALYDLAGYVSVALDAGISSGLQASTVVDCTGEKLRILRPGPIPAADLLEMDRN